MKPRRDYDASTSYDIEHEKDPKRRMDRWYIQMALYQGVSKYA